MNSGTSSLVSMLGAWRLKRRADSGVFRCWLCGPILDADGDSEAWPRFLTLDELEALDEAGRAAIDGDWVLYPAVR